MEDRSCLKAFKSGNWGTFSCFEFFSPLCHPVLFYAVLGVGIWWLQERFRCYIFTRQSGAGCINGIKAALKTDLPAGFLKISLEIPWVYAFYLLHGYM